MATALQDRVDERAGIWDKMTKIMDEHGPDLPAEKAQEYDRLDKDYEALEEVIDRANAHADRAAKNGRVNRTGVVEDPEDDDEAKNTEYARVFDEFLREGQADLNAADKAVLRSGYVDAKRGGFKNAAGVGTGAAGGYAVPPLFRDKFVEALKWYGPMLQEAETIETASGATLPWPTNDDTGNVGAILAEQSQVSEQDVTLGTASLDAFMYTSKLVRVSFQLLQDKPDFDSWLARKLGERVGRILNQHWTTGTGTAQPLGLVTGGTVRATGTGTFASTGMFGPAATAADPLIDLVESLDPAYGASTNLKWMMHQTARKSIRKLKDGQNRYLFEPSLTANIPDQLLGYPVRLNNDMPTVAVSSKSIAFGDFREAYVTRIVQDLTTLRLTERYADYLQVGFLAFERAGGTVQNALAYGIFQTTTT